MADTTQFDFLQAFIEKTLDEAGMESLTEETRGQYVPQFMAEAERRIGIALTPLLNEQAADELAELLRSGNATPEAMQKFWTTHVPNVQTEIQRVLQEFGQELKETLGNM